MEKQYQPRLVEEKIYALWEKGGYFTPSTGLGHVPQKKPFTIIMPPPNANDNLHIGHARFIAIEDILIRYHRMRGEPTLWLPGADHAGIETQYVFEKRLKERGQSRFDFSRETLYRMIADYVQSNKHKMENQLRALGASCDWSRNKFTLDAAIVQIVYQTFKRLYDDGLVYRGTRLVNYCTRCGTGYSNLEVEHVEKKDPLYYLKYGPFTLATVRPETKFGDTAVAVNPKDKRYQKWVGQEVEAVGLLGKFKLKVVADAAVDPHFGTGVVKVTPAHDPTDFEIGRRHHLEVRQVIGFDGKLNEKTGKYQGLPVNEARRVVVRDLEKAGLLVKVDEDYTHSVAVCYRCKTVIEPLPMEQWFVRVTPLVEKVVKALDKGETKFVAKRFEKTLRHWLAVLYDWNISRQIVWGMQIPAWRCGSCGGWTVTAGEVPAKCGRCSSRELTRDPDTFDTWFSSGQWPYATLQTTQKGDFDYFYPTTLMETGFDILAFWVMRMLMLGLYATGCVPFRQVLIHGLVRDKQGQKISKSKGNVIDPLLMTQKYGADALRMSLIWGSRMENDISLSEDNVRGQRNFTNKLWNITRFVLMSTEGRSIKEFGPLMATLSTKSASPALVWCHGRFQEVGELCDKVTKAMDNFRFDQASGKIYEYVWHRFADVHLETAKKLLEGSDAPYVRDTLVHVLTTLLKLLHPFMPFATEALWQQFPRKDSKPLIISKWPAV
jgi:valyl-tRNA synthetase